MQKKNKEISCKIQIHLFLLRHDKLVILWMLKHTINVEVNSVNYTLFIMSLYYIK
jgi:hypothetical protein